MPGRTSSTFMISACAGGDWGTGCSRERVCAWARPAKTSPTKKQRLDNSSRKMTFFIRLKFRASETQVTVPLQKSGAPRTEKMPLKKPGACIYTNVEIYKEAVPNVLNTYF